MYGVSAGMLVNAIAAAKELPAQPTQSTVEF